jgi:hypothetical protein
MLALLRKDAPWMVVFAVAGLLVAFGTVLFADPIDLLLFDNATAEATFWTALAGGLGLGLFAGVFDELLQTRELLRQRPVSSQKVMVARCLAVAMVLLTWHLALPFALLLWWPFASVEGLSWSLGNWLEPQATLAVAWPAAAAMGFAASLPLGRLARLLLAGATFYVVMLVVDGGSLHDGWHDPWGYLAACLLVAAVVAGIAVLGVGAEVDVDRPVATTMSQVARWGMGIGFALAAAAGTIEWESNWIQQLHGTYPQPWQQGREVVLVATRAPMWAPIVVDAQHTDAARPWSVGGNLEWSQGWPWLHRDNEFEQPRWRSRGRSVGLLSAERWYLAADGGVWSDQWLPPRPRRLERLSTDEVPRFSGRASLVGNRWWFPTVVAVVEPGADRVWRLDATGRRLVVHQLPGGDRVRWGRTVELRSENGFTDTELELWRPTAAAGSTAFGEIAALVVIQGERGSYALIGGELRALARSEADAPQQPHYDDPIVFARSLPATEQHVAFAHSYQPRTAAEQRMALAAMVVSSLRPPLLQGIAHLAPANARPGWLFDGLVVDGRRPWLVLVQVLLGAVLAWIARRSLVRHGVPSGLWVLQVLLFGFAAFLLLAALERPRRLRRRPVPAPPALRIGTLPARSS